jgi:hypothetical protein
MQFNHPDVASEMPISITGNNTCAHEKLGTYLAPDIVKHVMIP